ncbi:MAG: hypothetical protein ACRDTR_10805 [Rubrobacter sp.]
MLAVGNDSAPAVFSGEGEAALFLRFGIGDGEWRVRRTSSREILALSSHGLEGFTRVALDPLPGMTDESLASLLVDVGRYPFMERTPLRLAAS